MSTDIFRSIVGRDPAPGAQAWISQMSSSGMNEAQIRDAISTAHARDSGASSSSSAASTGSSSSGSWGAASSSPSPSSSGIDWGSAVTDFYQNELGRDPAQAGYDWWVSQAPSNFSSVEELYASMRQAAVPEAQTRVTDYYNDVLGRAPAQEGLDFWTGGFAGGTSMPKLYSDFLEASKPEFYNSVGTWYDQAGLPIDEVVRDQAFNVYYNTDAYEPSPTSYQDIYNDWWAMQTGQMPKEKQMQMTQMGLTQDALYEMLGKMQESFQQQLQMSNDMWQARLQSYAPVTRQINSETDTVAGQLNTLLSTENPYIQRARLETMEEANRRGLLNSNMAAGWGEGAAIDRGMPIAAQDSANYLQQGLTNQQYQNTAAQYNADQINQMAQAGYNASSQGALTGLQTGSQMLTMQLDDALTRGRMNLDAQLKDFIDANSHNRDAAVELGNKAFGLMAEGVDALGQIMSADMETEGKQQAMTNLRNYIANAMDTVVGMYQGFGALGEGFKQEFDTILSTGAAVSDIGQAIVSSRWVGPQNASSNTQTAGVSGDYGAPGSPPVPGRFDGEQATSDGMTWRWDANAGKWFLSYTGMASNPY